VGQLERAGLVVGTRTEAGGITRGTPSHYWTLTETGVGDAERFADALLRYPEEDRYKVNQAQIRHYVLAQVATINARQAGAIVGYETERMTGEADVAGEKRPDVIWHLADGDSMAVEIELSAKWDRKLDEFVLAIVRALQSKDLQTPARFSRFAIVTDSKAILKRYQEAMTPGAKLTYWKKDGATGRWVTTGAVDVPAWLITKIDFMLLEST
jgi:hypothetical protein